MVAAREAERGGGGEGTVVEVMEDLRTRADRAASDPLSSPSQSSSTLRSFSKLLVLSLGSALKRRAEMADVYETDPSVPTWTDEFEVRELLLEHLKTIERRKEEYEVRQEDGMLIRNLSAFLLQSFKSFTRESLAPREVEMYEEGKGVAVDLLRRVGGGGEGVDTAMRVAVEHGHWRGICEICTSDPHGKYGERELGRMVGERYRGGGREDGEFVGYVLEWLGERRMFASVLNVGRAAPSHLATYLRKPSNLRIRWINEARLGDFDAAKNALLELAGEEGKLRDRKVALSLAVIAGEAAGGEGGGGGQHGAMRTVR